MTTPEDKQGRLLIVSNRLPVNISFKDGEPQFRPSAGGLATGLGSFYRDYESYWLGWPGGVPKAKQGEIEQHLIEEFRSCPVFIPDRLAERYYEGFANKTLWPLLHSFPMYTKYSATDWAAYKEVNAMFCERIMKLARPGDIIWVHDYHLMLLPRLIRERMPEAKIGFFLHVPFPNYEIIRLLPWHKEIVESLMASDLVGFHTYDHVEAFLLTVRRLLGYDNDIGQIIAGHRLVQVDVFPIGIDYERFSTSPSQPEVLAEIEQIKHRVGQRKLVFSVSRLDYTKGIPQHLEAVEELFQSHSEWRERLVYHLVVVPSREKVERYASLKREIDEAVGRINSKYGTLDWMPIWYVYRHLSFEELIALYAAADVALVAPLRDGMNLIAKEYVATRSDDTGVLVLSETAGAAKELLEALIVNPNSKEEAAEAMHKGLSMAEEEQVRRNRPMRARLKEYDIKSWAESFLKRLLETVSLSKNLTVRFLDQANRKKIIDRYQAAKCRLMLLDYDGTLTSFVENPEKAEPSERVMQIIKKLAEPGCNEVVLISGRNRESLTRWFGNENITLVSEHGGWVRRKGETEWEQTVNADDRWKKQIRPLLELFVNRIPGSFIEEKSLSLVWHYRKADIGIATDAARELVDNLTSLTANLELNVLPGNKVVEIRSSGITKGAFYLRNLAQIDWDFILSIGDDRTDESLFAVLPEKAYSIRVGFAGSNARFNLESSADVLDLLEEIAETTVLTGSGRVG